jgi:hypothetical protein
MAGIEWVMELGVARGRGGDLNGNAERTTIVLLGGVREVESKVE